MASNARLAVRFFSTVHARVHAVRKEGADMMTPERFPAVLAATAVVGLVSGWQIMDRVYSAAVCCGLSLENIVYCACQQDKRLTVCVRRPPGT